MWRPVAFALTETETRYAQIEKEALALTWACEKFSDYILGKPILLETNHKPLVPILESKSLDSLPPRVLCFRLPLARFQYTIHHAPGKSLYLADTLSRAPVREPSKEINAFNDYEVEKFVEAAISSQHQLIVLTHTGKLRQEIWNVKPSLNTANQGGQQSTNSKVNSKDTGRCKENSHAAMTYFDQELWSPSL